MFRKLIVLLLVVTMSPAASQLLEVAIHLVRHGDYAFADDDSHQDGSPNEEHGCSELFHRCSCHSNAPLLVQQPVRVAPSDVARAVRAFTPPEDVSGLDDPEPPLPPPISVRV